MERVGVPHHLQSHLAKSVIGDTGFQAQGLMMEDDFSEAIWEFGGSGPNILLGQYQVK